MGTLVTLKAQGKNSQAAVDECFDEIFALVKNSEILPSLEELDSARKFVGYKHLIPNETEQSSKLI